MSEAWVVVDSECREPKEAMACFKILSRYLREGADGVVGRVV